jgi:hypothetical protein
VLANNTTTQLAQQREQLTNAAENVRHRLLAGSPVRFQLIDGISLW